MIKFTKHYYNYIRILLGLSMVLNMLQLILLQIILIISYLINKVGVNPYPRRVIYLLIVSYFLYNNIKDTTGVIQEASLLKINDTHPIYQFKQLIQENCNEIREKIRKYAIDKSTKDFKEKKDIKNIITFVENLHMILRKAMDNKEISNILSIGLSTDPGLDTIFLDFFTLHLQKAMKEVPDKILAINYKVLLSSSFDKEVHRAELKKIIEIFPKEVAEEFREALKAIDNLS